MKKICFIVLLALSSTCFSQNKIDNDHYQTRKKETIQTGDTLLMGIGSAIDGSYMYVYTGGSFVAWGNLAKGWNGIKMIVTGIKTVGNEPAVKHYIECIPIGRKRPKYLIEPDAAFIKEEVIIIKNQG